MTVFKLHFLLMYVNPILTKCKSVSVPQRPPTNKEFQHTCCFPSSGGRDKPVNFRLRALMMPADS